MLHIGHKASKKLLAPGGHVEDNGTLLAAALREVCEETGLRPGDLCLTPQFLAAPSNWPIGWHRAETPVPSSSTARTAPWPPAPWACSTPCSRHRAIPGAWPPVCTWSPPVRISATSRQRADSFSVTRAGVRGQYRADTEDTL
nr:MULTISPECIES: NUDIX domain-containing protein [Streptomyces]